MRMSLDLALASTHEFYLKKEGESTEERQQVDREKEREGKLCGPSISHSDE